MYVAVAVVRSSDENSKKEEIGLSTMSVPKQIREVYKWDSDLDEASNAIYRFASEASDTSALSQV